MASSAVWLAQKRGQRRGRLVRFFFRKEVTAIHGLTRDVFGERPPQTKRTAFLLVPAGERPSAAPERQHRTGNAPPRLLVELIVAAVDRGCGAVFFANAVSMGGITQIIPGDRVASRRRIPGSLMMSAAQLNLSAQDVADIVAFLRAN